MGKGVRFDRQYVNAFFGGSYPYISLAVFGNATGEPGGQAVVAGLRHVSKVFVLGIEQAKPLIGSNPKFLIGALGYGTDIVVDEAVWMKRIVLIDFDFTVCQFGQSVVSRNPAGVRIWLVEVPDFRTWQSF